jgi:hypothetical protein
MTALRLIDAGELRCPDLPGLNLPRDVPVIVSSGAVGASDVSCLGKHLLQVGSAVLGGQLTACCHGRSCSAKGPPRRARPPRRVHSVELHVAGTRPEEAQCPPAAPGHQWLSSPKSHGGGSHRLWRGEHLRGGHGGGAPPRRPPCSRDQAALPQVGLIRNQTTRAPGTVGHLRPLAPLVQGLCEVLDLGPSGCGHLRYRALRPQGQEEGEGPRGDGVISDGVSCWSPRIH